VSIISQNSEGKNKMRRNKEIKISLTEEEMKRIEKIAEKIGITKSRLARNLVITSLEDVEILEKLGFFEIAKLLKKIKDKALQNGQQS
jgi:predicted DNA-binding protein